MAKVRWNISVSDYTDRSLRFFLARRKGNVSGFVEEAVRAHILALAAQQAKAANAGVPESDLSAMIDEAVQWARK